MNGQRHALCRVEIDLRARPAEDQVHFWQGVAPTAYRVGSASAVPRLDLRSTLWTLPELLGVDFAAGAHRIDRHSRSDARFVKIRDYRSGGGTLASGSGRHALRPGRLYLIDHARPWSAVYGSHAQRSLLIPHDRIGYDSRLNPVLRGFRTDTPEGLLLHWALDVVWRDLRAAATATAEASAERFCTMLAAVLRAGALTSRDADVARMRADALRHMVARNRALARSCGVSRSTLFRAFEEVGGLRRFARACSLDLAHDQLQAGPQARGRIARIAEAAGFCSIAHFSNAFLDRFGMRPSGVAGQSAPRFRPGPMPASANDPGDLAATLVAARACYARMTG